MIEKESTIDTAWSEQQLARIDRSSELEIAVRRRDGTLRSWTPIWVVRSGNEVYVRSWYRRGTGWFGRVLDTGRARVRVGDLEADVTVTDLGAGPAAVHDAVDEAYRAKYGDGAAGSMVSEAARETTLVLAPEQERPL